MGDLDESGTLDQGVLSDLQTEVNNKAPIANPTFTGVVSTPALTLTSNQLIRHTVTGITASVTQTQGNGVLTGTVNEVTTVANTNDTVTLPTAVGGLQIEVKNNGSNTLQIFPASGDDLGEGINTPITLIAGNILVFSCIDSTNWYVRNTPIPHYAEMYDQDNTDAFVITDAGTDRQSYHTNGLTGGTIKGWTFDAGGAGTSYPIASIADGGGGEIAVTTTGEHGLAVGDIISQSNCADTAYNGVFVVNTINSVTEYEVTAVFTATDTGTVDQGATLGVNVNANGIYKLTWNISATPSINNDNIEFGLYKNAAVITGSKIRNKFGNSSDFDSVSGNSIVTITTGDKISFFVSNLDGSGNVTIRDINVSLIKI
jgi:hypothetical protein